MPVKQIIVMFKVEKPLGHRRCPRNGSSIEVQGVLTHTSLQHVPRNRSAPAPMPAHPMPTELLCPSLSAKAAPEKKLMVSSNKKPPHSACLVPYQCLHIWNKMRYWDVPPIFHRALV